MWYWQNAWLNQCLGKLQHGQLKKNEAHCNHIIDGFGAQHADKRDEDGASGASMCEADDGDETELNYLPIGPYFGINHHVPELGDK